MEEKGTDDVRLKCICNAFCCTAGQTQNDPVLSSAPFFLWCAGVNATLCLRAGESKRARLRR